MEFKFTMLGVLLNPTKGVTGIRALMEAPLLAKEALAVSKLSAKSDLRFTSLLKLPPLQDAVLVTLRVSLTETSKLILSVPSGKQDPLKV